MSKHTPGPWTIHAHAIQSVMGSTGFCVASCGQYTNSKMPNLQQEQEANTKLIAAAPDLLECLEGLLNEAHASSKSLHPNSLWSMLARSAIARAKGESQ